MVHAPQIVEREAQMSFGWEILPVNKQEATESATVDLDEEILRLQIDGVWPDSWAARHNHEVWKAAPDGTYAWRNQADGCFE